MTEAPMTPRYVRERMTQLVFEGLGAPAYYALQVPVAALFATGRRRACISKTVARPMRRVPHRHIDSENQSSRTVS